MQLAITIRGRRTGRVSKNWSLYCWLAPPPLTYPLQSSSVDRNLNLELEPEVFKPTINFFRPPLSLCPKYTHMPIIWFILWEPDSDVPDRMR